jgi:hypothetical protein
VVLAVAYGRRRPWLPAGVPVVYYLQTWSASGRKVVWGLHVLVSNKGGYARVPTRSKIKSRQMRVTIDLAEVFYSGRLRWRTPIGDSCLEMTGSGGIRSCAPMCSSDHLVLEGALRNSVCC